MLSSVPREIRTNCAGSSRQLEVLQPVSDREALDLSRREMQKLAVGDDRDDLSTGTRKMSSRLRTGIRRSVVGGIDAA